MDSDNDSYYSENEFYYPDEENVLQENKNIVNTSNDTSADQETSLKHKGRKIRPDKVINKVISEFSWMCVMLIRFPISLMSNARIHHTAGQ